MNTLAKSLGKLGAVAMIATFSFAFATPSVRQAHNVYNANTSGSGAPDWQPLTRSEGPIGQPGTYRCDNADNVCTAFQDPATGQILDEKEGMYQENN
ncbi:MAG: hypothetical protein QHC79_17775 [Pseudosphingobacterium sp.]|uniref:hypothetical protein n=1 Tax=Olivibacter sp. 47 TaxID=3056486 RepID=UPI0025A48913|nr:hypothetical protein [Olivibacter sp. 47]MDM8173154.1 hypothetical protein [Olivibacter sp. 47]MDX3915398.1 hypothetical protein [Pseudosphingobacterium sp.]